MQYLISQSRGSNTDETDSTKVHKHLWKPIEGDGLQQEKTIPSPNPVWDYNFLGLTTIGQNKIGLMFPDLISLDFWFDIQVVGSEMNVNIVKSCAHPALFQLFGLLLVVV